MGKLALASNSRWRKVADIIRRPIRINTNWLAILSLAYLYMPLVLFLCTWTKWWVAALGILASGFGIYKFIKSLSKAPKYLEIKPLAALFVLLVILAVGAICGWGGWFPQTGDWSKHNAVINDLVHRSWPVYYTDAASPSMLTYYIGQYLVPCAIGKLLSSFNVAAVMMYAWGVIGLALVVVNLFNILKANTTKRQLLSLAIFLGFSGCIILAQKMYGAVTSVAPTDQNWMTLADGVSVQYRSIMTSLRWVMPQAIATWLAVTVLWNRRNQISNYVTVLIPTMLTGILPFAGIIVIFVFCAVFELASKRFKGIGAWLRDVFSVQNIVVAVILGLILLFYYSGNIFYNKPDSVGFSFTHLSEWGYIFFITFMFGIYCLLIWKDNKTNGLFWGSILLMLVLPWFRMGYYNDLPMSCSMPAIFIVYICVNEYILTHRKSFAVGCLAVFLFVGAINPIKEISEAIRGYVPGNFKSYMTIQSLAEYSDIGPNSTSPMGWRYNYYSYNIDDNIFVKYLAADQPM